MTTPSEGSWLGRLAPRVARASRPSRVPKNLWVKCPQSGELIYRPDLEAAQWVTPSGFHMRIGPALRLAYTFDAGRYEPLPDAVALEDPLGFTWPKPYAATLAAARKATGQRDSMSAAAGRIGGIPAVALVQSFDFIAGSLSVAAGETFVLAAEAAIQRRAALVAFTAAAGARMQESTLALMQMARATAAIQLLKQAGLPYVVVLTDPTIGGVTASYAMLGDVCLAEPGATVGFTGRRVIGQTIRETLPDHYQTADFQVAHGMADQVVPRRLLPSALAKILHAKLEPDRLPDA